MACTKSVILGHAGFSGFTQGPDGTGKCRGDEGNRGGGEDTPTLEDFCTQHQATLHYLTFSI